MGNLEGEDRGLQLLAEGRVATVMNDVMEKLSHMGI